MKLKEKISKEYVHSNDSWIDDTYYAHEDTYLAGFEKAREMAAEIADEYSSRSGTKGPSIEVADQIKCLGEEEIG